MSSVPMRLAGFTPLQRSRLGDTFYSEVKQNGFFRTEVMHGLRVLNAKSTETVGILRAGYEANLQSANALERLSDSVGDLGFTISSGLSGIEDGFSQLHADNVGSHELMTRIWQGVDPAGYRRAIDDANLREATRRRLQTASSEYQEALHIVKNAAREENHSKARIMFEEAIICFQRACNEPELKIDAHLQLGTLCFLMEDNFKKTAYHLEHALGAPYSPHWVRVSRLLAQAEYRDGNAEASFQRTSRIVDHLKALEDISTRLREIRERQDWEDKRRLLKELLETHASTGSLSSSIRELHGLLERQRAYTALEGVEQRGAQMERDILALRPDFQVLSDAARYAAASGSHSEAKELLEKHYELLDGKEAARRLMLLEALADPELRNV